MSKWWPLKIFYLITLNILPKYPHSYHHHHHHHHHQGTTWSPILWLIFKITWTLSSTTSRALNGLVCFSDKKLTWNKKSPCLGQKHLEKLGVWHWGQLLYHLWWLNLRNQIFNRFWQGIQFSETSSGITTDRGCGAGGDILQYMQVDMQYMQYMHHAIYAILQYMQVDPSAILWIISWMPIGSFFRYVISSVSSLTRELPMSSGQTLSVFQDLAQLTRRWTLLQKINFFCFRLNHFTWVPV